MIRSFMGRRKFIMGAAATSALGVVSGKIAGAFSPVSSADVAESPGRPAPWAGATERQYAAETGNAGRYAHLLSPLKIGNVILKNRMLYTVSTPHFLQGPEIYPADVMRSYFANVAQNGAAIVTCRIRSGGLPRKERSGDSAHIPLYDTEDPAVLNYIDQLVEGVHCHGSLASIGLGDGIWAGGEIPEENSQKIIDDTVVQALWLQTRGFDMVYMGGDGFKFEKNGRHAVALCQAVKQACGRNFLIGMLINVKEPTLRPEFGDSHTKSHYTLTEAIAVAKMLEGAVDILQFRLSSAMASHPTGFNQKTREPLVLRSSQAIKESGAKIIICPNGGFRDPDLNNGYIASGKTDMIAMARSFIADWEYGKKIYEGRGEDVAPCIMCNKCHGLSMKGPWFSVCSVNPALGISSAVRVIQTPTTRKKVAVIGGGPAGMKAAVTAAERGHSVTLYEKNDFLGGLLRHTDFSTFKWPLKDYKDYLVRQTYKTGVEVRLGTEATPDMLQEKGYDVVLAAVGAAPVLPRIPGADGGNVWDIAGVYGNEAALGDHVVIAGGGEYGVETGMHLAACGRRVTVLTSGKELLQVDRVHYPEIVIDAYEHLENFDYVTGAVVTGIANGKVVYVDAGGGTASVKADDVVVYAGLRPNQDEALSFSSAAGNAFFAIGDCTGRCGDVQKAIRNAYFAAAQI